MAVGKTRSSSNVPSGKYERRRVGLGASVCVSLVLVAVSGVLLNVPSVSGSEEIGVHAGDWMKYAYSQQVGSLVYTQWVRMEFLSIGRYNVTMSGTLHLSDGTEQNETFTVDVSSSKWSCGNWDRTPIFDTLSGFVIPANISVSTEDNIQYAGMGFVIADEPSEFIAMEPCGRIRQTNITGGGAIDQETERTYVGTSRTVVHASFLPAIDCWWDKQTGVLVEMYITGSWAAVAVETNMWQTSSPANALDPAILYTLAIVVTAIVVATVFLVIRRMRKPPEIEIPQP